MSDAPAPDTLRNIKLIGFDVDGVFTDGRFYLSDDGTESKSFHTQDGFGIRQLVTSGIHVAIISGRASAAVERRMRELDVQHVHLACREKLPAFMRIVDELGLGTDDCAYVGDDIPDLPLLLHAGTSFAVSNAVPAVKDACDYITTRPGGFGAVREICDLILAARQAA